MGRRVKFRLNIPGRHIALNALAALSAVAAAGGDLDKAAEVLRTAEPVDGRGSRRQIAVGDGPPITLIDESYNANPASMAAALSVLEMAAPVPGGRRIAVLGDMLELGPEGPRLHAALANPLLKARVDLVFCCGPQMEALYNVLPEGWKGGHAPDSRALAPLVSAAVKPGDVVLVKGSAGSKMAYIVEALQNLNALKPKDNRHAL
jgi:UDP-N-acetylmuramoyl-tripeptide--D-alanyl-D-alanine ligase